MNENPGKKSNAILLMSCPDRRGLIARITDFVYKNNGNIEHADQHVDHQQGVFFMRIEWSLEGFKIPRGEIGEAFSGVADSFSMEWDLFFSDERPRVALFVSRYMHCLYDLLFRYRYGWFNAQIPLIISNHPDASRAAEEFNMDFHKFEINGENKHQQEEKEMKILKKYGIETVVLCRYMQVLSKNFVDKYPNNIINIHHSFLPAFAGAGPYEKAHGRGVKIIGATSHYVTEKLDEGPIIEQDVVRVNHRDTVEDLKRKGQDLEKVVLARALKWHLERKILVYGSTEKRKTVIFD